MTTELEKQFFDTFGIRTKLPDYNEGYCDGCEIDYDKCERYCPYKGLITDRILLELICVFNKELIKRFDVNGSDLESLKSNILSKCIKDYTFYSNTLCKTYNRLAENFKHQVQAIFKESE